ncbi:DUF4278 domain-containing protein [Myxosarcina sp. GI1(2024)]
MQLTYRGIKYQTNLAEIEIENNQRIDKNFIADRSQKICGKSICYYTYRGISYIKYPVFTAKQINFKI